MEPEVVSDQEEKNTGDNPHEELLRAAEDLAKLADWCEEKYVCETSREEVKFAPGTYRLYGGKALKTTGQYAVQALKAVAINSGILASALERATGDLGDATETLAVKVDGLRARVKGLEEDRRFEKLKATAGRLPSPRQRKLKVVRCAGSDLPPIPSRVKLDFTLYDSIGYGRVRGAFGPAENTGAGKDDVPNAQRQPAAVGKKPTRKHSLFEGTQIMFLPPPTEAPFDFSDEEPIDDDVYDMPSSPVDTTGSRRWSSRQSTRLSGNSRLSFLPDIGPDTVYDELEDDGDNYDEEIADQNPLNRNSYDAYDAPEEEHVYDDDSEIESRYDSPPPPLDDILNQMAALEAECDLYLNTRYS